VYYKEYDAFLQQLRDKGMLHVIEKQAAQPEEGSELQRFTQRALRYDKALREMRVVLGNEVGKTAPAAADADADLQLEVFEGLLEDRAKKVQEINLLQKKWNA
jgi:V/A-type H+-transporting ATPase subunit I